MSHDDPVCDLLLHETERIALATLLVTKTLVDASRSTEARALLRVCADVMDALRVSDEYTLSAQSAQTVDAARSEAVRALRATLSAHDRAVAARPAPVRHRAARDTVVASRTCASQRSSPP